MDAIELLKNRRSCRNFSDIPIDDEVLDDILDVGLNAASGGNTQPCTIIKIRDKDKKSKLKDLLGQNFIEKCDIVLVFLLDFYKQKRWCELNSAPYGRNRSFLEFIISLEDVMCVAQSIECACTLKGIGSVYLGTPNLRYEEIKELLELPKLTIPILAMCLGNIKGKLNTRKKLHKEAVIFEEKYKKLSDDEIERYYGEKYQNSNTFINDKNSYLIDELCNIASTVNGKDFADKVKTNVEKNGYINPAQKLFGLHYNPIQMIGMNQWIWNFFKEQGFDFLDETFHINRLDVK
ncbi:nitroreductase [Thermoanaerobacterium thermosaccharolyticum]|uniref:nitroreductase family protein n=1 Tax=Thermoanaerobacterium thermosaccharolyticum TaxID=1517 RepID=UPI000C073053|nr:nitroreductase family protein [Thermoanaerobacterium thermosaccharolyticum]PHO08193.1 nitroreductase [Thermoanaerobacterium thermosaccharolyticum]